MDSNAGSLAANADFRGIRDDTDGIGLVRQGGRWKPRCVATDTAGPDRVFELVQFSMNSISSVDSSLGIDHWE
ncbi:hypothetical protein Q644_06895 [Brucella intermedia 229E]|uniref:Uncharacterized protein n=1 Tax=Brucella intermedia 229E TaxID=1337887 RepID=U4V4Y0_9HYPH|nr:hypothetical protein Q644_06895 [Brucella intermedia 229E]